jgi:hypothetical protein
MGHNSRGGVDATEVEVEDDGLSIRWSNKNMSVGMLHV